MTLVEDLEMMIYDNYRKCKVPVYKNPNTHELRYLFRDHHNILRAKLEYGSEDFYVWDSELLHDSVPIQGYPFVILPNEVRLRWYSESESEEDWEIEKQKFESRSDNVWRAFGRRMPIIQDEGEYL